MKEDISFDTFYQTSLLPEINSLDVTRKSLLSESTKMVLCLVAAAVSAFIGYVTAMPFLFVITIICLVVALILSIGLNKRKADYQEKFRQKLISKIISYVDNSLDYSPDNFISQQVFAASELFKESIDTYSGGNYVEGELGKTKVRFSELFVQHEVRSGKNSHMETMFQGIFFIADFNKNFTSRTTLMPNDLGALGVVGNLMEDLSFGRGARVKLESDEFNKYFVVYSTSQQEARYILSPTLMERIVRFRNNYRHDLYFLFSDSSVYIAIPTDKNLLDTVITADGLSEKFLKLYFDYINMCAGLIEELDLNTRIWTKE